MATDRMDKRDIPPGAFLMTLNRMNGPHGHQQGAFQPGPGRKIREVERATFPSGQHVDFIHMELTFLDQYGHYATQAMTNVFPPPHDGSHPLRPEELVECCQPDCHRIVSVANSFRCAACLGIFDQANCGKLVEVEEQGTVLLCPECAAMAKHPWLTCMAKAVRSIWE